MNAGTKRKLTRIEQRVGAIAARQFWRLPPAEQAVASERLLAIVSEVTGVLSPELVDEALMTRTLRLLGKA